MFVKTEKIEGKVEVKEVNIDWYYRGVINIVGPNGCGKSTISKYILEKKDEVVVVSDYAQIPSELKVSDVLKFCEISDKMEQVITMLNKNNNKRIKDLSTGEKRLLEFFVALSSNPKIVILDEVTSGLDVRVREEIFNIIGLIKKDLLLINITHNLKEILNVKGVNLVYKNEEFVEKTITSEMELKEVIYEQL